MEPTISYQDCSVEHARNASTPHVSTSGSRQAAMQHVHYAETSFRRLALGKACGMCVTLLLTEPSTRRDLKMGGCLYGNYWLTVVVIGF